MLKKVFNGFMLLLNIGMSALLLLACLLPYISVALVPSMSIFSLFVPFFNFVQSVQCLHRKTFQ